MAENEQAAPVQFDAAQMNASIQEAIRSSMANLEQTRREEAQQAQVEEQRRSQSQAQQDGDPLLKVMKPYLDPLNTQVQSAIDAATFYTSNHDAAKYKDEIEAIHRNWLSRGITVTRDEAWHNVRGRHLNDFVDSTIAERTAAAETAKQAGALGPGMSRNPGAPTLLDHKNMSLDDLEKALQNVSF